MNGRYSVRGRRHVWEARERRPIAMFAPQCMLDCLDVLEYVNRAPLGGRVDAPPGRGDGVSGIDISSAGEVRSSARVRARLFAAAPRTRAR